MAVYPIYRKRTGSASRAARDKLNKRIKFPGTQPVKRLKFSPKIKGEIIYHNPKATPVGSVINAPQKRALFTMDNVEWISLRPENRVYRSNLSEVFVGKVKFKGLRSAQFVAVKRLFPGTIADLKKVDKRVADYQEVIKRLNLSSVRHPKMAFFKAPDEEGALAEYIVQEPFFRSAFGVSFPKMVKKKTSSKFGKNNEFFGSLYLHSPREKEIVVHMLEETAKLANAGLGFKSVFDVHDNTMVDVFALVKTSSGKENVYVQDIDNLFCASDRVGAWRESTNSILKGLILGNGIREPERSFVRAQIELIGRRHGLL